MTFRRDLKVRANAETATWIQLKALEFGAEGIGLM
jgi:hypothetical protein